MLPNTLALIDDDAEYTEFLAEHLRHQGVRVDVFPDSIDLLSHADAYSYGFYIVDLMLPGVDGTNLIKVLRRRTNAGVLVVSGRLAPEVFREVISAGADMYLTKPVHFDQISLAVEAVHRRTHQHESNQSDWTLDRKARQLIAPDGARTELSEIDLRVIECFVAAAGDTVSRESLAHQLERDADQDLNAVIFRLRRRIEKSTPVALPLQSKSRVGYVFRAPLKAV